MTNPLKNFMRTEKLYVSLPSAAYWYDESIIELTPTKEIGVMPMTAIDELTLTSPDALLNGEGLRKVIESCCPAVKNARKLMCPDLDTLYLAIRIASYGEKTKFKSKCPQCDHINEFIIDLVPILNDVKALEPPYVVELSKQLSVEVKPYNFETNTKKTLESMEIKTMMANLQEGDIDEDFQIINFNKYAKSFEKLKMLAVNIVIDGIVEVRYIEAGQKKIIKSSPEHFDDIVEWLANIDRKTVNSIKNKIYEINNIQLDKEIPVECEECKHKWNTLFEFNPTNFFD